MRSLQGSLLFVLLLLVIPILARPVSVRALEPPPPPRMRVVDQTGTLSQPFIREMDRALARFEEQESSQIVVLMIPTLAGDVLEDYSIRLAEKWQVGQRRRDNGVIVLVVKDDRRIRIEVGYGLEGRLPDSLAGEIIRTRMVPRFRSGDFEGGIRAALTAIMAAVRGEYRAENGQSGTGQLSWFFLLPFLGLFVIVGGLVLGHALTCLRYRKIPLFMILWSLGFSGIPLAMTYLGEKRIFLALLLNGGWLLAIAVGYRLLPYRGKGATGRGRSTGSGWQVISGGSGGSSGGGFSGGGGSFGGGGASGSW